MPIPWLLLCSCELTWLISGCKLFKAIFVERKRCRIVELRNQFDSIHHSKSRWAAGFYDAQFFHDLCSIEFHSYYDLGQIFKNSCSDLIITVTDFKMNLQSEWDVVSRGPIRFPDFGKFIAIGWPSQHNLWHRTSKVVSFDPPHHSKSICVSHKLLRRIVFPLNRVILL